MNLCYNDFPKFLGVYDKMLTLNTSEELGLQQYYREVQTFPILSNEEEYVMAKCYQQTGDIKAAHKLVTSHLRYVVKIAFKYKGYGLPMSEIIAEGNIGLMQAVKKFNPDKGFRLVTYAVWWIKAFMQEYILRSWSLVRIGTTVNQKKLFFNLKKLKNKILSNGQNHLTPEHALEISNNLNVSIKDIASMEERMMGDSSLNAPIRQAEGKAIEAQELLTDNNMSQELTLIEKDEATHRHNLLEEALSNLQEREQYILRARRLSEPVQTLEVLADKFKVSRERIRQIEQRAFEKLQQYMTNSIAA